MTLPDSTSSTDVIISDEVMTRKKFLGSTGALATGAVVGTAAYLGSTGTARASGTSAYLNVVETFTANQTFLPSKAIFDNGQIWFDVRAFGATGNGTTNDAPAINSAIAAAVSVSSGTNTTNNPIVYFPPGNYLLAPTTSPSTTGTINPPLNGSNYTLLGAGYQSSRLIWGSTNGSAMLRLSNAGGVVIKDLGFVAPAGTQAGWGIQIYRAGGLVGSPPTDVLVERVFIGGVSSSYRIDTAIAFDCVLGNDASNDRGTFRDVTIQYVVTGYGFGTPNTMNHVIEGGVLQTCELAVDNTPMVFGSTIGGSYTVIGTRFFNNNVTFNINQAASNEGIHIIGIQAGTPAYPEQQLINTPTGVTDQSVTFVGGHANTNSVLFNTVSGLLEFHGFRAYVAPGPGGGAVTWSFPGTGQVNFYGGTLSSASFAYNGTLQFHGTRETLTPTFTPTSGSTTARLLQFGYNNHFGGATALIPAANLVTSSGVTVTGSTGGINNGVTGSDVGGQIILTVTGSSVPANTTFLQVKAVTPFVTPPNLIFCPGNTAAAQNMLSIYSSGNTTTTFYLKTSATATLPGGGTQYIWNYLILG
jgi:hypothetical protein